MKYINKITLENFQSHKYTELDLIQGLNIIVGPSDTGKSAIIRGLKWALYNEPSGDYFIREGESKCSVSIEFNDTTKLKRMRTKSKNIYILTTNKGEEFHFEGFGTSVPDEIISEIGIKKSLLDNSESNAINLGEQLDGAFLLSERSSVRASAIGRIVGVNIIDDALKEALRDLRNYSLNKKNLVENMDNIDLELKNYDYLDIEMSKLNNLKVITNKLDDKLKFRTILSNLMVLFNNLQYDKKIANLNLDKIPNINTIEVLINNLEILIQNKKFFHNKLNDLSNCLYNIKNEEKTLLSLKGIGQLEDSFNNIEKLNKKINTTLSIKLRYEKISSLISRNSNIIDKLQYLAKYEYSLNSIGKLNLRLNSLNIYKGQYEIIKKRIASGLKYLEKLNQLDKLNTLLNNMELDLLQINKLVLSFRKYKSVQKELEQVTLQLINLDKELEYKKKEYKRLLSINKICPYCFSVIDHVKIKDITDKL